MSCLPKIDVPNLIIDPIGQLYFGGGVAPRKDTKIYTLKRGLHCVLKYDNNPRINSEHNLKGGTYMSI